MTMNNFEPRFEHHRRNTGFHDSPGLDAFRMFGGGHQFRPQDHFPNPIRNGQLHFTNPFEHIEQRDKNRHPQGDFAGNAPWHHGRHYESRQHHRHANDWMTDHHNQYHRRSERHQPREHTHYHAPRSHRRNNEERNHGYSADTSGYPTSDSNMMLPENRSMMRPQESNMMLPQGDQYQGGRDYGKNGKIPVNERRELIMKALEIAGVSVTEKHINDVDKIVKRESDWKPGITNNWDSNARKGHPSTGLMQTIPSTFAAYAAPGHNNINDPLHNLVAGIRYANFDPKYRNRGGLDYVASRPGGY